LTGIAWGSALAVIAALLAAVALALIQAGVSGGSGSPSAAPGARLGPPAPSSPTLSGRPERLRLRGRNPIVTVRRDARIAVRSSPRGPVVERIGARTEFGSPRVLSVLRRRGNWIAVTTPVIDGNRPGWIRADVASLRPGRVPYEIVVDLGERRVELRRRGEAIQALGVTVGAAGTSTPEGRFAVTDVITRGLSPAYGCCAVALSARQPNLPRGWLGGDRVAIHGTPGPVGGAASSGCLRARNGDITELIRKLPLGTPVRIRA
jgi:hypothetical protein